MKLVTYLLKGTQHSGLLIGSHVVDATEAARAASIRVGRRTLTNRTILGWSETDKGRLAAVAEELAAAPARRKTVLGVDDVTLGPPIPDPEKVISVASHLLMSVEASPPGSPGPSSPISQWRIALAGPDSKVVIRNGSEEAECECVLAVVIGRNCHDAAPEHALEFVAGYMALNHVRIRQRRGHSGPNSDHGESALAPCGPALVVGELGDPGAVHPRIRVNGRIVSGRSPGTSTLPLGEMIAAVSRSMTLVAGDVIYASARTRGSPIADAPVIVGAGDVVEVEIPGIGVLRNPVVSDR